MEALALPPIHQCIRVIDAVVFSYQKQLKLEIYSQQGNESLRLDVTALLRSLEMAFYCTAKPGGGGQTKPSGF